MPFPPTAQKIMDHPTLAHLRQDWAAEGATVVFTNGCFDLLHLGHLDYLEKAAALGDYLIVALNSDASVRRLKGPTRPIHDIQTRARMLAALTFTDAITVFEEDTPLALIERLLPSVLVKGGDYDPQSIVGGDLVRAHGGCVLTIPFLEGHSSSQVIAKIQGQ
ncbi:MAG: D-glycero-beta-D-manno-heptose 1-phosphate adenylyltransferase [Bernardetiaceae bacterium]